MSEPSTTDLSQPLVTLAMPVFNAGQQLRLALLSIIQQSFRDWELLVIDDGSTDGSVEVVADIIDSRIRIIRDGQNRGLAARLNEAIDLARGRFFARMDQDDVSYPERLSRQLAMLERDPEIDLCAVRCVAIDSENTPLGVMPCALTHEELCAKPWMGFYLPHPTWFGRLEWFRRHRYASPGPYFCEDQELLLRSHGESRFASTPEILFAYRVRRRLDWKKSLKTRQTLLGLQLRYFLSAGQYKFGIYAAATFLVRFIMDLLNAMAQNLGCRGFNRQYAKPINADERLRWSGILNQLAMAGKCFE